MQKLQNHSATSHLICGEIVKPTFERVNPQEVITHPLAPEDGIFIRILYLQILFCTYRNTILTLLDRNVSVLY